MSGLFCKIREYKSGHHKLLQKQLNSRKISIGVIEKWI